MKTNAYHRRQQEIKAKRKRKYEADKEKKIRREIDEALAERELDRMPYVYESHETKGLNCYHAD